jgi:hypothetical protein
METKTPQQTVDTISPCLPTPHLQNMFPNFLKLVEALNQGKTLEMREISSYPWKEATLDAFSLASINALNSKNFWRVKPEPKFVPLDISDIKPGMLFRHECWEAATFATLLSRNRSSIYIISSTKITKVLYISLFLGWWYSMDGDNWHWCRKEIVE